MAPPETVRRKGRPSKATNAAAATASASGMPSASAQPVHVLRSAAVQLGTESELPPSSARVNLPSGTAVISTSRVPTSDSPTQPSFPTSAPSLTPEMTALFMALQASLETSMRSSMEALRSELVASGRVSPPSTAALDVPSSYPTSEIP